MGINKSWRPSSAFLKFRNKTFALSRVYWTQQLSVDCLMEKLSSSDPDALSAEIINCSFESKMHPQSVAETKKWIPSFLERSRLYLLVIYTAFLESYLKEITFSHVASNGHVSNLSDPDSNLKLSPVGEALASPILRSSTIPDMLKYASEYYDIDFGNNAKEWIKIYKVRCIAAHNGGIATPKFLKDFGNQPLSLNPKEYDAIGLTWEELRKAMRYGDEIAAMIDYKVANYGIRIIETELVLREARNFKKLPKQNKIWEFLHDKYALHPIRKKEKLELVRKYY